LALTSPTGGGRSVGIVRVRTKATEFSFYTDMHTYIYIYIYMCVCVCVCVCDTPPCEIVLFPAFIVTNITSEIIGQTIAANI